MFHAKIEEIIFNQKHIPVRVKINKEIEEEIIKELEIDKAHKGAEINIPWWKARILIEDNSAELVEEKKIDQTYIQKKIWSERAKTQLDDLDNTFYLRISHKLNELKKENKQNPNPILIQKIESLEIPLNDLLSTRITKILKMAFRRASPKTLEKLTSEEKWLYENINRIIEKWVEKILGE